LLFSCGSFWRDLYTLIRYMICRYSLSLSLWDRVSLCSLGWPQTPNLIDSASQVLDYGCVPLGPAFYCLYIHKGFKVLVLPCPTPSRPSRHPFPKSLMALMLRFISFFFHFIRFFELDSSIFYSFQNISLSPHWLNFIPR
jgi:hypothetical protein